LQSITPLSADDFKEKTKQPVSKLEIYIDGTGWVNLCDLNNENYLISANYSSGQRELTYKPIAAEFSAVVDDTNGDFNPRNDGGAYKDYLKIGRKIRFSTGFRKNATDYLWQWFIGAISKISIDRANKQITIKGFDYTQYLVDTKLKSPDNYWGSSVTKSTVKDQADYELPAECNWPYIAYFDGNPIYEGDYWVYDQGTNKFWFLPSKIPDSDGTDNLVIYYYTDQVPENVVADLLVTAGLYANRASALAAMDYTATGETIEKVRFNSGVSVLSAIQKICERCDYEFYFEYDGTPVFKPIPSADSSVFTFDENLISNFSYIENIDEVRNHIVIEGDEYTIYDDLRRILDGSEIQYTLDEIPDGSEYGRVKLTGISAGLIIVAGLDAEVTDRMFTDPTAKSNIEGWRHASDVTMIDGGKIYTSSIVADSIDVGNFMELPSDEYLMGYWSFDEGSGMLAVDNSGNGNNGTLINSPIWKLPGQDTVSGGALRFDSYDDEYVDLPDDILDVSKDFSVSFWCLLRSNIGGNQSYSINPRAFGLVGTDKVQILMKGRNQFEVKVEDSVGTTRVDKLTPSNFSEDVWYHVVVTVSSTNTVKIYVNAVEQTLSDGSVSGTVISAIGTGISESGYYWHGHIDEVRVYQEILTTNEVKALYLNPAGNKGVKIHGGQIEADTVTATQIAASTITTNEIASSTITTDKLAFTPFVIGTNDLDDVPDGSNYARVLKADISAGHILLSATVGDLDDIADGSNYGKVALTGISAGKIVVAGLDSGVTARMFTDSATKSNIEGWRHASDVTMIDGGDIYAGSITVDKLTVGRSPNLLKTKYSDFQSFEGGDTIGYFLGTSSTCDTSDFIIGDRCLKLVCDGSAKYVRLALSNTDYNIRLKPSTKYIISCYARSPTGGAQIRGVIRQDNADVRYSSWQDLSMSWQRYQFIIITNSSLNNSGLAGIGITANATVYIDAIQVEEASAATNPEASPYKPSGTVEIHGGQIEANTITTNQLKISDSGNLDEKLKIYQGTSVVELIDWKATNVNHQITNWSQWGTIETDTFLTQRIADTDKGGIWWCSLADGAVWASWAVYAFMNGNADTVKNGTTSAVIVEEPLKGDPTNHTYGHWNANANIWGIRTVPDGSSEKMVFFVDEDGDFFYDGSGSSYQTEDDVQMVKDLEDILTNRISKSKMKEKDVFKKHKIIHISEVEDEEFKKQGKGKRLDRYISGKKTNLLLMGAIRQLSEKIQVLEEKIEKQGKIE